MIGSIPTPLYVDEMGGEMKLLVSLLIGLICVVASAEDLMDKLAASFENVVSTTGATASVQSSTFAHDGYVERVSVTFLTNTTPVKIKISTSNEYSGLTQTIFTDTNGLSTNFTVYPRITTHTTTGSVISAEYTRIPMIQDKIVFETWGASTSNQNVLMLFYYNKH